MRRSHHVMFARKPLHFEIILRISQRFSLHLHYEVNREVTCHPMYAAFHRACFYTHEVRKWMEHGGQYLSSMPMLREVQPEPEFGSEKREDSYGITRTDSNFDRGSEPRVRGFFERGDRTPLPSQSALPAWGLSRGHP